MSQRLEFQMVWAGLILAALPVVLFSQETPKKPTKPDTWERSKECAAQSEKLIAEYDREAQTKGLPKTVWQDHYSPKYNRCFLQIFISISSSDRMTTLHDPFERSTLAIWDIPHSYCEINSDKVECDKAFDFITEHMKN